MHSLFKELSEYKPSLIDRIVTFLFYKPYWLFRDVRYELKQAYKRVFQLCDDRMVWNLWDQHAEIMEHAFTRFVEEHIWYPEQIGETEWDAILKQIRDGFKGYREEKIKYRFSIEPYSEKEIKASELRAKAHITTALTLMAKYYPYLWD